MKNLFIVAASAFAVTSVPESWALGLGELTLNSYLNEPLEAEVRLLEADGLDVRDVRIQLASDEEFDRLGVQRAFFLTRINFQVEDTPSGMRVRLQTDAPLREPYLDLVVEARWPDGRLLREYTVLVDLPPRLQVVVANPSAAVATPGERGDAIAVDGADVAMGPVAGGEYLVTNSDTLWRIASRATPEGISIGQTMLAIRDANPEAFQGGNINGLKSGYVLILPSADDIAMDAARARAEVAEQNSAWLQNQSGQRIGLTLVADSDATGLAEAATAEDINAGADEREMGETSKEAVNDWASEGEIESLLGTIDVLEASISELEAQIAEKDAALAELQSILNETSGVSPASEPESVPVPVPVPIAVVSVPTASPTVAPAATPLWLLWAGGSALVLAALAIVWRIRRGRTALTVEEESLTSKSGATPAEKPAEARLSDPQILASKAVEEAEIYIAYGRVDQAIEVLNEAIADGLSSQSLNMRLLECLIELERVQDAQDHIARLEAGEDTEVVRRARQLVLDAGMVLGTNGDTDEVSGSGESESPVDLGDSVLSEFSFSTDPAFAAGDAAPSVPDLEIDREAESAEEEKAIAPPDEEETSQPDESDEALSLFEGAMDAVPLSDATLSSDSVDTATAVSSVETSLTLAPLDGDPKETQSKEEAPDESIYGVETDPIDSKLDLARAYLDMGDEEGARPVLTEVIRSGNLSQQAEARELLLRLEGH